MTIVTDKGADPAAVKLAEGFARFHEREYGPDGSMLGLVSGGQHPDYAIISCADSRTPQSKFDQVPGTIFSPIRCVGAIYRGYGANLEADAGIKYAIDHLQVKNLVLVGHYDCGFIKGMVHQKEDEKNGIEPDRTSALARLIDECEPLYERVRSRFNSIAVCRGCESHHNHVAEEAARWSTDNLRQNPVVSRAIKEERLKIFTMMDDMNSGELLLMNPQSGRFEPLYQHEKPAIVPIMAPHCADAHLANKVHFRPRNFMDTVGCAPGKTRTQVGIRAIPAFGR